MSFFKKENKIGSEEKGNREEEKRIENVFTDLINLLKSLEKGDFTAKPKFPEAFSGKQKPIMEHALGMIGNLTKLINKIKYGFSQIKKEMEQISQSTEEVASSTQECSMQLSSLDQSSQQISEGIKETADQAENIAKTCATVGTKIQNVTIDIVDFEKLIHIIFQNAKLLEGVVISIQNISQETNLLSLNAQIEAARAGEAGRSFAVIAQNLSSLNEQTTEEAKKSAEIINDIFEPIKQAQNKIAGIVAHSGDITQSAEAIVNETAGIAETAQKQSAVAEQIAEIIHSIGTSVENNAAASQESAASIEEALSLFEELSKMLNMFKTDKSKN